MIFLEIRSGRDIETAFATLTSRATRALLIGTGPFTNNNRGLLVALAARYAMPAMYAKRDSEDGGGLMGYGASCPTLIVRRASRRDESSR